MDVMEVVNISDSDSEESLTFNQREPTAINLEIANEKMDEREELLLTLTRLSSNINHNEITRFNVHRPTVWESTLRKLRKKDFSPGKEIMVRFSDNYGSEEGIDQGGPRREFLCLVMEYLMQSNLFDGEDHAKTLSWNKNAHDKDLYYYAGVMIALSIVHGGPAPHCFSPLFVAALEHGTSVIHPCLDDLPDVELKTLFEKLLKAKTPSSFQKALDKLVPYLSYAGIDYYNCKTEKDAEEIMQKATHHYLFDRTRQAFERFTAGLRTLGVYDNLRALKSLFIYKDEKLNKDSFELLFTYELSEKGSNSYNKEIAIVAFFRDLLEDAEDEDFGITLSRILYFITGMKTVPPLGFTPKPSIRFWDQRFPKAETCTNTLYLPTKDSSYEEFCNNLKFAILNTQGFMIE